MVAVLGLSKERIFDAVRDMYTQVATMPAQQFHFPTGRDACLFVGYPADWRCGTATGFSTSAPAPAPIRCWRRVWSDRGAGCWRST